MRMFRGGHYFFLNPAVRTRIIEVMNDDCLLFNPQTGNWHFNKLNRKFWFVYDVQRKMKYGR